MSPDRTPETQKLHIFDEIRPGLDAASIRKDFVAKLYHHQARFPEVATPNDCWLALAGVVRDRILDRWIRSTRLYYERKRLTIGTLDGANVEIRERVGDEHFFLFGLTVQQVADTKVRGWSARHALSRDPEMARALQTLALCADSDPGALDPLVHALTEWDPFLVLADWRDYIRAQGEVNARWQDTEGWTRSSILNVARCGTFSSDRAIAEYARDIWRVEAVPVPVHGTVKGVKNVF